MHMMYKGTSSLLYTNISSGASPFLWCGIMFHKYVACVSTICQRLISAFSGQWRVLVHDITILIAYLAILFWWCGPTPLNWICWFFNYWKKSCAWNKPLSAWYDSMCTPCSAAICLNIIFICAVSSVVKISWWAQWTKLKAWLMKIILPLYISSVFLLPLAAHTVFLTFVLHIDL